MRTFISVALLLLAVCLSAASAGVVAGRNVVGEKRPFSFNVTAGYIQFDEGTFEETRRAYDNSGQPVEYGDLLSSYTIDDLGLTGKYPTYGLSIENQWKYVTLRIQGNYLGPSVTTVARMKPTSRVVPPEQRGYYLSVNEIEFDGQTYEYMFIPDGTEFTTDLTGWTFEMKALITPVTFAFARGIDITPWLGLGVYGLYGEYTIDAGPARGVVQYEIPPEDYVVCGRAKGDAMGFIPEIGAGSEVRFWLWEKEGNDASLTLQGEYLLLDWKGSTDDLGISSTREKDLDLNYGNYEFRLLLEVPLSARVDMVLGASYKHISGTANITAQERSPEAQQQLNEKYDKRVDIEFTQVMGLAGVRF